MKMIGVGEPLGPDDMLGGELPVSTLSQVHNYQDYRPAGLVVERCVLQQPPGELAPVGPRLIFQLQTPGRATLSLNSEEMVGPEFRDVHRRIFPKDLGCRQVNPYQQAEGIGLNLEC
jgi:hypothetical protein